MNRYHEEYLAYQPARGERFPTGPKLNLEHLNEAPPGVRFSPTTAERICRAMDEIRSAYGECEHAQLQLDAAAVALQRLAAGATVYIALHDNGYAFAVEKVGDPNE